LSARRAQPSSFFTNVFVISSLERLKIDMNPPAGTDVSPGVPYLTHRQSGACVNIELMTKLAMFSPGFVSPPLAQSNDVT